MNTTMCELRLALVLALLVCTAGAAGPATTAPAPPADANKARGDTGEALPAPPPDSREADGALSVVRLRTDSEVESLLSRAREAMKARNYGEAATILQHVIDRPGNTLAPADGGVYLPARRAAEAAIAAMPREGMEM